MQNNITSALRNAKLSKIYAKFNKKFSKVDANFNALLCKSRANFNAKLYMKFTLLIM